MELEVPDGVKAFNLWTIWIMARLWEEFPRQQFFSCVPGGVYVTNDSAAVGASFGPIEPGLIPLFGPTMEWLLAERYVTGKSNGAGHFALVVLTQKGCSVLKQIPRSVAPEAPVSPNKPLGALMREATITQGVGTAVALVKAMVGAGK
jgi:hypothetical protein